jgi:pimeloyl-ACP methyl ester carboxylesterase
MFSNGHNSWIRVMVMMACLLPFSASGKPNRTEHQTCAAYFDSSGRDDVLAGGVKMVEIKTSKGRSGLGSAYSDQPDEPQLWEIPRFVDEVEQVRQALKIDRNNFYLFGHSWGGVLAIEYALAHQEHLAGCPGSF